MFKDGKIWIANSDKRLFLLPKMANRHGIISGATGTGKTITMKVLAESFSDMGVPVFFSDVKGDLSGMCEPGADTEDMRKRIERFGIDGWEYKSYPTRFWDIFGDQGTPVRVTVSDMGPQLLSRLLNLTEVQTGVMNIVFRVADENGLNLIDFKDLRAMVQFVGDNRKEFTTEYGLVSTASIGAIQRALLEFSNEGGEIVFGEPGLDIRDWMRTDYNGRGYINILNSARLINSPKVYATFLLWMLTALFEKLPEVGDLEKPRIIFFFDEAHVLFDDAPRTLVQKIVRVVKLIRSKGVGVYFVTQSPSDIPDEVLAQLSNRIQHCLRAYTPNEQKSVRAAAKAFRVNPSFDTEEALMALGTGEALVSFLDEKGVPSIVENAKILPPQSLMGATDVDKIESVINGDELELKYRDRLDRESAYEIIAAARREMKRAEEEEEAAKQAEKQRLEEEKERKAAEKEQLKQEKEQQKLEKEEQKRLKEAEKEEARQAKEAEKKAAQDSKKKNAAQDAVVGTAKKAATSAASSVASSVSSGIVGSLTGGKGVTGGTIAKRAAKSALASVIRQGATSIIRGIFGNKK
ncbi:MAG: DUF853 family protein [Clostridia bacterium]|nr:DUF853 family protein [Clostridia bacterium]